MKLNLRQLLLKYNILFIQVCTIFTLRGGEASMFFFLESVQGAPHLLPCGS